jgi:hypothetical protein
VDDPPAPPFDPWVCPRCLRDNDPLHDFCEHCGAPAYGIATTGPFQTAISQGWAVGEAVGRRRPPWIVALGGFVLLTLFFLPAPLVVAGTTDPGASTLERVALLAVGGVLLALWVVGVARLARNVRTASESIDDDEDAPA